MSERPTQRVAVIGGGIVGLWQAVTLTGRGHRVRLYEQSPQNAPFSRSASWFATGLLAQDRDGAAVDPLIQELGRRSMTLWRAIYPEVRFNGSLVVARPRDRAALSRLQGQVAGGEEVGGDAIAELEPDLAGRFQRALFFRDDAHLDPREALGFLLNAVRTRGCDVFFGVDANSTAGARRGACAGDNDSDWIIDCRGISARDDLADLGGLRGEVAIVASREIAMSRPVHVLHPRYRLHVVPRGDGRHVVGASEVDSADDGPVSARAAIDLLGTAYALHPAFGEADILELDAAVCPVFRDLVPRIVVKGRRIYVNGTYRHGFMTAPALAELTAALIEGQPCSSEAIIDADAARDR